MPKMNGIQLLRMLQNEKIRARVMMASTDTCDGAKVTMEALDLGAIDFIEKPVNIMYLKSGEFKRNFLEILKPAGCCWAKISGDCLFHRRAEGASECSAAAARRTYGTSINCTAYAKRFYPVTCRTS